MAGFETKQNLYYKPSVDTNGDFDFTEVDNNLNRYYVQGTEIQMVRQITPVGSSAQQVRVTDGTDIMSVNADGSLNSKDWLTYLSQNGTLVLRTDTTITAGTRTMYTVTAGKTLYLFQVGISGTINSGFGATATVDVQTDADGTSRIFASLQLKNGTGGDQHGDFMFNPSTPLVIPAGKLVQVVTTAHYIQRTMIFGYEI